ncbi:TetR/AcrR family transcriptional regulator C-terminal domain-containing protein [Actinoplanes aureus]|uniref:TetR/AcrR family transcriptional regulator C-terminal domain-containing protein n=1 Tax=Actinoplanes aureus TaxID=2792083 RepID=A0A931C8L3_9ACTN|nr:TetR/AcrR family transcriptional regulator C-terminal domain-containing protein [Actinoplanes aureus]MBG0562493.1 TetR/AcrR family transcriptional regulator C-terminal domain-containing protein [Actinoplanes aureus]
MPSTSAEPVHRRIAALIAARITSGELAPGDRIPSTRQIMAAHGVAMATASKVIAALREQGLVQATPGSGTVVSRGAGAGPAAPDRDRVVATAVTIADAEGLPGLSMRRLAGELGIPTMSLYRHVADKEDLVLHMMDRVMAAHPPPGLTPAEHGWRACVQALARIQWSMYRRHTWLAQAISFTRPLLAPHAMAHTEYVMRALDGHGLDPSTQFRAAVMVANYVRGTAVNLEDEAQAEQETGMSEDEWLAAQQDRLAAVLATGRLPMLERFLAAGDPSFNLDVLLEFGLQRLLDGLQPLLSPRPGEP